MIQTAPSMVARQIAPSRCARISPGAPAQRGLAVRPEEMEIEPFNGVEHARVTLGGVDAADHGGRRIGAPVDRAVALADQRARPADHARVAMVDGSGACSPAAIAVTASVTAAIAARRTSWR